MVPQVGDIVLVIVDPALNNGSDVAPGVLTRINSDLGTSVSPEWARCYSVNAKAFLDSASADQWLASAALYGSEAAARAAVAANPNSRALFPKTAEVR